MHYFHSIIAAQIHFHPQPSNLNSLHHSASLSTFILNINSIYLCIPFSINYKRKKKKKTLVSQLKRVYCHTLKRTEFHNQYRNYISSDIQLGWLVLISIIFVSFSNLMRPKKLISIWRATDAAFKSSKLRSEATKDAITLSSSKNLQSTKEDNSPLSRLVVESISGGTPSSTADSAKQTSRLISSVVVSDLASELQIEGDVTDEMTLDFPWYEIVKQSNASARRRLITRDRKQKWVFKNTQNDRYDQMILTCASKLGLGTTLDLFGKLGHDTSLKGYNTLIGVCLEKARKAKDENDAKENIGLTYNLLQSMKNQGLPIEEEAYGPILTYLIDMHMVGGFNIIYDFIKEADPSCLPRLGYYQMLLWIELDNGDKIQEIYNDLITGNCEGGSILHEYYLLALCERDRRKELLQLLDVVDITAISSLANVASIFRSLGRLSMEPFAYKFIVALRTNDCWRESISDFIYYYASTMTHTTVENTILKFKDMHTRLEVEPRSSSYEMLIEFCCDSQKVYLAWEVANQMFEAGLSLSTDTLNFILHACEQSCEYNLVQRIYSMVRDHNLKPNTETFRSMINSSVRMKDFGAAYTMLDELQKMNLLPTANMYNAIIAGYFREKNMQGVSMVLKGMEHAGVKPDSQTFTYLIGNSESEEEIIKHYGELKNSGVHVTKQVYMALINAYVTCGQFEKAKLVVMDEGLPVKHMNEIKSSLVSALASHGQMSNALEIYEEIKEGGACLEPKAVISIIEHTQETGKLSTLLKLLDELSDRDYWIDGCHRVISYCVTNNHLRSAVDLLKRLSDKWHGNDVAKEVLFDEVFSKIADMDPPALQMGLELLQSIKEEIKLQPSRKCLDFLLAACVNAKDLQSARFIWKEYQILGLPYNVLSFLRMFQAFLASGDLNSAKQLLDKIPRDDPHVRSIIEACFVTYNNDRKKKKKKKKKSKT